MPAGNTTLLLSTFTHLLQVTLDPAHRLLEVRTVEEGLGIYFGLTRDGRTLYAVARNLDIHKSVVDSWQPANAVHVYRWPWRPGGWQALEIPGAIDLHQIRFRDGLLWLTSGHAPELLAAHPGTGRPVGHLALGDWVPADLAHAAPAEHPADRYHFNSLHFGKDRLYALAHNWGRGSFAMEFEYLEPASLFASPRLVGVHRGLGLDSHDLFPSPTGLVVLDSGNGRLLAEDGARRLPIVEAGKCYLRGLAVGDRCVYAAHGVGGRDRDARAGGPSRITVLDRETLVERAVVEVGSYGNTCDCLLLSETDWSDSIELVRPGRRWLFPFRERRVEFIWPDTSARRSRAS